MTKGALDPRLNTFRSDLADAKLKGQVEAERFVEGQLMTVGAPVLTLRRTPDGAADTELLFGETVTIFDNRDGWSWVQAKRDGYTGYVVSRYLTFPRDDSERVGALSTFIYAEADLKSRVMARLPHLACVSVGDRTTTRGTDYVRINELGWAIARHIEPIAHRDADFVEVARRYLRVPYLWAGRSAFGLDCSGLVQNACLAAGIPALRDTDMQEGTLGAPLEGGVVADLQRGDLVFWAGHVGIMTDSDTLLHANGNTMDVTEEPLNEAIERIERLYQRPTSVRRLP